MRRKLWQGLIPTEIRLADKDVATDRAPEPYYVFSSLHSLSYRLQIMLPRISFFAAAVPDVIEYFKEEALDVEPNIWFEFCGKPLRGCVRFSSPLSPPQPPPDWSYLRSVPRSKPSLEN
jgi:hypothetical protein